MIKYCAFIVVFIRTCIAEAEIIPRSVLFGNPERAGVRISPDGSMISYLAPHNGVLNVWVQPIEREKPAFVVTNSTDRPIRSYTWAVNGV